MKKKKNLLYLLLSAIAIMSLSFAVTSCKENGENQSNVSSSEKMEADEIYFEETNIQITLNESTQLSLVGGENAVWTSTDEGVATVDQNGIVMPVAEGITIIKASVGEETAMCRVEVVAARAQAILALTLSKTSLALYEGDSFVVSARLRKGSEFIDRTLKWESAEEGVATVSQDGVIVAIGAGETVITVSTEVEGEKVEEKLPVTVSAHEATLIVNLTSSQVLKGECLTLESTVVKGSEILEKNADGVQYSVSNSAYAYLEGNVLVGNEKGWLTLFAEYEYNGEQLSCSLAVRVREQYVISYMSDGETIATTEVLDGDCFINEVADPEKENHRFDGWFRGQDKYDFSLPVERDFVLKAKWYPYDFAQSFYGASVSDKEGNSAGNVVSYGGKFEGGLHYKLPSNGIDYVISLPCIDYSAYSYVEYKWMVSGWCFVGPAADSRDYGQADYGGVLKIINNIDSLLIEMIYEKDSPLKFTRTITDVEVIYGQEPLKLSANTLAENRWLDISAVVCSNEVLPQAVGSNGKTVIATESDRIDGGILFDIGEYGVVDWNVTLGAIDYSAYKKVTYAFKGNAAWMTIGFVGGQTLSDSTQDSNPFNGTITIINNGDSYTVEIYDSATGNKITGVITDEEVIYGEKGFTFFVNNGAAYRKLHVGPAITTNF